MAPRLNLQEILKGLCDNVYFQPKSNIIMTYPCIVYQRDFAHTLFADNGPHRRVKRYLVTVMDRDPDSPIPDKIADLPMCTFNRHFTADDLHHDVYYLYY